MRLRAIDQLFDPVDPSPFGHQDLSQWAAEYIVESVKEMRPRGVCGLELLLAGRSGSSSGEETGAAVRRYFGRQSLLRQRALGRLLRRGLITLGIGVTFLVSFFGVSHLIASLLGDGPVTTLLREGSLIVGWVAMWRPIEIFLYDWWPIVGERRVYDRLSQIDVRVVEPRAEPAAAVTAAETRLAARALPRWENEGGLAVGIGRS